MPTLTEVKTNLVNEFYQQDFMTTQEAAAWINSFLDKNCKEVFEKAEKYNNLNDKINAVYGKFSVLRRNDQEVFEMGQVVRHEFGYGKN